MHGGYLVLTGLSVHISELILRDQTPLSKLAKKQYLTTSDYIIYIGHHRSQAFQLYPGLTGYVRDVASAAAYISSASVSDVAIGFSQSTCFPAAMAISVCSCRPSMDGEHFKNIYVMIWQTYVTYIIVFMCHELSPSL